ncbi:MAG: TonB-dependent receptor [Saprospiraceae bacterium]|nr:TonB-dependent receptor [Saprospiraceae bacterium]
MRNILLCCFAIASLNLQAQVKGRVTDAQSGSPLPYATVSLFSATDSLLLDGAITDDAGLFTIDAKPASYFAKVEFLAYEAIFIEKIEVKKAPLDLGSIKLKPSSTLLNEVVVEAEKSTMQMGLDKRVFNVGKDLANAGGNAAELLSNIPSVQVDVEGNVSLRGSANVRILIDGKPSGLVSVNGSGGLQQLQGSLIERVEIITNPSARYEAEGVGGIINIILKKEQRNGFNGSVDLVAGHPSNLGLALNVNYRHDRLNFFINYGITRRTSPGDGSLFQKNFPGDTLFGYNQTRESDQVVFAQNARAGLDFYLNPKNTLTASYSLRRTDGDRTVDMTFRDFAGTESNIVNIFTRRQAEFEREPYSEYALAYKKTFDKKGQEFIAEVRVLDYWESSDQDYTEKFYDTDFNPSGQPDRLQNSYNYESERQYLVQADYVQPIGKEGKVEGGLRSSMRDMDNDFLLQEQVNGVWETLPGFDDRFLYLENIHAAYGIFGNRIGNFGYQAGLRAELTGISTELVESKQLNERNYANFFPSAHLTYELPKENAMQVSYSRRIRRPRYNDLSPFITYSDERNFWSGNPDLNPEFTDAYELGHIKYFEQGNLSSSIYYRYTTGKIERIRRVDDEGIAATRPENLSTEDAFGLEFTSAYNPAKWVKLDGNFNFFRSITDGGNLNADFQADTYSWFARITSRFTFWKNTDLQVRGNYEAKMQTTQGYRKPLAYLDLALSQDLLKNNATITLNVSDVFNSRRHRHVTEGATFYTYNDGQSRTRQINLTFSYRLHQQKRRSRCLRKGRGSWGWQLKSCPRLAHIQLKRVFLS